MSAIDVVIGKLMFDEPSVFTWRNEFRTRLQILGQYLVPYQFFQVSVALPTSPLEAIQEYVLRLTDLGLKREEHATESVGYTYRRRWREESTIMIPRFNTYW